MKKQTKKKLEQELSTAIESVLAKHDNHAISKTKKAIKSSVKTVVKKFSKTIKALAEQKEAVKAKRKTVRKVTVKKTTTRKPATVKYNKPKNVTLSPGTPGEATQPIQPLEGYRPENS